jgi:hypothetical protein
MENRKNVFAALSKIDAARQKKVVENWPLYRSTLLKGNLF